ncbi:lipoprotein insertase outer membrane protein LolB [Rheinheimera sp. MMS21-TC3]|uniref:lipoprotein insertase outer membrane protein LolB n=1 Tax=Rheinheimera sp. MMS21-TC3 TaxID=3072790 RepID=UPI0028C4AB48|nr:lipoprotein insertase outer membrane protein LolB [Rheinheimera sp. MMS21-TC3]WNO61546.1 lipoprotein insertase outer membrane protein LolB [Rheinheimera sp. MMS21-TC3]
MANRCIRMFFVVALGLWLTGCSIFNNKVLPEQPLAASARQQQLQAMQQFSIQASVSIKTPQDSISGNLHWQQLQPKHYTARLSNFLGISLFELEQSENGSQIQLKGEAYYGVDTSSLLWQLSGWSMPLADMPLWLRGLPGKNSQSIRYDELGRVTHFNLIDSTGIIWQLEYQSFFTDSLALPKRLLLSSDDTRIKLVIRSWQ